MKKIVLTRNQITIVDNNDFERLNRYKWQTAGRNKLYGKRTTAKGDLYIHRVIMNAHDGEEIDHINGNTLDNRKSNLRICTHAENIRNKKSKSKTTGFKGVTYLRDPWRKSKYRARVRVNGIVHYSKCFPTAIEAAKEYDVMARRFHGKFCSLNFPTNSGQGVFA